MIDKGTRYRAIVHYERFYGSLRGVAKIYSVSKSSLQRWIKQEPASKQRRKPKQIRKDIKQCIESTLSATPFLTLSQLCGIVSKQCGLRRSSVNTASKWLKDLDFSRKKVYNTVSYSAPETLATNFCSKYSSIDDSDIVCIDEAGFYVGDHGRYGYSKRGSRIHVESSRTLRKNKFTLIMAIGTSGIIHYHILSDNCKKTNFIEFIKDLPQTSVRGKTLVMDNVSFHHSKETLDAAKLKGCDILHIPPYSPRFNAIEYAFGTIKRNYRHICSDSNLDSTREEYLHALIASLELCGTFDNILRRVRETVATYLTSHVLLRYD